MAVSFACAADAPHSPAGPTRRSRYRHGDGSGLPAGLQLRSLLVPSTAARTSRIHRRSPPSRGACTSLASEAAHPRRGRPHGGAVRRLGPRAGGRELAAMAGSARRSAVRVAPRRSLQCCRLSDTGRDEPGRERDPAGARALPGPRTTSPRPARRRSAGGPHHPTVPPASPPGRRRGPGLRSRWQTALVRPTTRLRGMGGGRSALRASVRRGAAGGSVAGSRCPTRRSPGAAPRPAGRPTRRLGRCRGYREAEV